ncbi:hypothetical protein PIIN_00921 [Serendipita indica DSM 11827]|uniref:Uncharacterized protein n=1 Tax=Serendipita indica (strain DSM 11827) TaxID=1109443 RepID=G4T6X9_SERID|nr:hypothetical protein PIIN_00921 [Serendipita indica DSM 11827]
MTHVSGSKWSITALPAELLYSIHLWALNPAFPLTNRSLYATMKNAPRSISARYLFYRHENTTLDLAGLISHVLKYPLCTPDVFERFLIIVPRPYRHLYPNPRQTVNAPPVVETPVRLFRLPRRLFRSLEPDKDKNSIKDDATFTFLESLYKLPPVSYSGTEKTQALLPDSNSHDGYPLIKAVQAKNRRLINLLLAHKADPSRNQKMAVLLAIQQRDLSLVKLLVEGTPTTRRQIRSSNARKGVQKKTDLVVVDNVMLGVAVKESATEIVEWLVKEKGVVPDIKTLRSME